jgi:hypothetical protein
VSGNANARTISLTRDDPSADFRLRPLALSVYYLITVHGTPAPAEEQSTERLLEAVYHTIEAKPVLHSADLESALPGRPGEVHTATARIVQQALSFAEIESLFTALHAIYRPTLVYLVTLSEA